MSGGDLVEELRLFAVLARLNARRCIRRSAFEITSSFDRTVKCRAGDMPAGCRRNSTR
jgi:hypothetical protein